MSEINEVARKQPAFADFLGLKVTHISPERVTAELVVREELNNRHGIMHGGAIMSLADNLGGTATMANLKPGQIHRHDREQDQFLRRHSGRRCGLCRMHAAASRPLDHGLADPRHPRRRQTVRAGDADADGADAREIARRR